MKSLHAHILDQILFAVIIQESDQFTLKNRFLKITLKQNDLILNQSKH